ncbi:glycoside hydrolase family 16 protein [Bipolaris sorokiniana ND90Pr]|uniref:Crh-like protein n=1 Tax=Cochliobolus sativus (strain ND90Pr / ATCC 201652) TaxID=665912 RepID=M2SW75_COCSN|nr:glycoside hydrolase family 16 protein [Bipolaris sorokiniana ND90Pr]EMD61256.1 glycoside hydrolase family 16 protein [Bipolaris sorokiniana ND90Pr]
MLFPTSLLVLSGLTYSVFGQTHTDCNPTKKSCPAAAALDTSYYSRDFTKEGADDDNWKMTAAGVSYSDKGAEFKISKKGDHPTIQSKWYIFFGSVSFLMRVAPGTGIVSSAILQSDDLDEIDWEWLGGQAAEVQTNYFSKGNTATYNRMAKAAIPSGNAETELHNYTISWTQNSMQWIIDGSVQREVKYADVNSAYGYPQTPMNVRIGIWAGGDPDNSDGTIEWAGGLTDFGKGPYSMVVEKVEVINHAPAKQYHYGDLSGTYDSIVVDKKGDGNGDKSKSDKSSSSASASASASASKSMTTSMSSSATASATSSATTSGASSEGASNGPSKTAAAAVADQAASTSSALPESNGAGVESVKWRYAALMGAVAIAFAI